MSLTLIAQLLAMASGLSAAHVAWHSRKSRADALSLGMLSAGALLVSLPQG